MKKKYYVFELEATSFILNFMSIVIFIVFCLLTVLLVPSIINLDFNFALYMTSMILYFIFHEVLHSIAYSIHGGDFKRIVYGVKLESGVLYCLCKQNISKKCILYATMYPLIFIGILTYIIGIIFNFPLLIFLSICNLSGCIGDIFTFIFIKKLKDDIEFTEMDNPLYFAIYADYDVSKIKTSGIKFVEVRDDVERKDLKKITISKPSYFIIGLLVFLILIYLFL